MVKNVTSSETDLLLPDFPKEGPSIHSKRKQYQVGETADLICNAQKSSPSTQLSWYINGEPVSRIAYFLPCILFLLPRLRTRSIVCTHSGGPPFEVCFYFGCQSKSNFPSFNILTWVRVLSDFKCLYLHLHSTTISNDCKKWKYIHSLLTLHMYINKNIQVA